MKGNRGDKGVIGRRGFPGLAGQPGISIRGQPGWRG
jgi:hypothetical protein